MGKRSLISAAGLALLAAIFISGCRSNANSSDGDRPDAPSASVALVQRGSIVHALTLAGQFEPYQVVDVHAKVSGYIRHIYVDIGDKVRQGQVLAVLEVPELSAQLKGTVAEAARRKDEVTRAEHDVVRAESDHSALHADYMRLKQAAATQPGLIAQQELDDAQAKDLASEAQVDAAKAALAAAKQNLAVAAADNERVGALESYTTVTAPLNGVIIWRYADTGALIQAGTSSDVQSLPVVKLSQSDLLRLRVPVPEMDVRYIHIGDPMEVRVDAVGRSFTGKVVRFTRNVSLETRTMETEIDVKNDDLTLDPGMYAHTHLQLAQARDVLTIPIGAILQQNNRSIVYALDGKNRVRIRPVEVGIKGSFLAEIKSGLEEGDRVILAAQQKYSGGEQVIPVLAKTPINDVTQEPGSMIDLHDEQENSQ